MNFSQHPNMIAEIRFVDQHKLDANRYQLNKIT